MFTGLVEDIGTVRRVEQGSGSYRVTVATSLDSSTFVLGESIAVNGACFTVVDNDDEGFAFEASPESLERTTLGEKSVGARVHLERAMVLGGRLGGHLVQGHIDGIGRVLRAWKQGNSILLEISAPEDVGRFLVPKGSITIDGVSLTVNRVLGGPAFQAAIIPHTSGQTLLSGLRAGAYVNLEADIIGKYVHSLLGGYLETDDQTPKLSTSGSVTLDLLRQHGFLGHTSPEKQQ